MLKEVRETLENYLNDYELAKGFSKDYYCDELLFHPMAAAKYILTLCSLYRSGLLSHSRLIQRSKFSVKKLFETKINLENTENIFWGLGYKWQNLEKSEPYLITTSIVVHSLLELEEIIENDLILKNFSQQALVSLESWVKEKRVYCLNMNILIPKYSFTIMEPVFNSAAYANAVILKYSLDENIKIEAQQFMNLLWKERTMGVGWKYSNSNDIVDLLHTCYIQNSYFISQDSKIKENICEAISMVNQFNCGSYFNDVLLVKHSFNEWQGDIIRYIDNEQYLELKVKKARLWSIGELLVLLSNMMKVNNNPSIEK